jgi:hypothetical protein
VHQLPVDRNSGAKSGSGVRILKLLERFAADGNEPLINAVFPRRGGMFGVKTLTSVGFAVAMLGASMAPTTASAVTFGFERITNNSPIDAASQFSVDVTDGGGFALFDFTVLAGLQDPNVAEIYFDVRNGSIVDPITVAQNIGTSFSPLNSVNPGDLPGGGSNFNVTSGLGIDSDVSGPPAQRPFPSSDGLNIDDTLVLSIAYGAGFGFDDLIAGMNSGQVRIGMHVRSLANGQSDSFVTAPTPIPLPAAAWMLLAGLGGLGMLSRRKTA